MAAPHYVAGIDFNTSVRQDAFDVMGRLIDHYRNKSTDQAPDQWREPVRNYRDQDLWRQEIQGVFKKVPLPLALLNVSHPVAPLAVQRHPAVAVT